MKSCPTCLNLCAEGATACDFCGAVLDNSVVARAEGGRGARTPTVVEAPPRPSPPPARPSPPPPRPSPPPPLPGSEVKPASLAGRRGTTEYAPPQPANAAPVPRAPARKIIGILVSYSWKPEGQVFPVREGRNLIGRGEECEIRVTEDASMSQVNSHITFRQNFVLGDMVSMSGTDLNGEPVEEQFRPLTNYAQIRTGSTHWTFVVIDPALAERGR